VLKDILTNPTKDAPQELHDAATLLKDADHWYEENIKQMNEGIFKALKGELKTNHAPDPEAIAGILFSQPFNSEQKAWFKQNIPEPLLNAVISSDVTRIVKSHPLDMSEIVDGKPSAYNVEAIADELRNRLSKGYYSGLLTRTQEEQFSKFDRWAHGKQLNLTFSIDKDDTATSLFRKAKEAKDAADTRVKIDPITALQDSARAERLAVEKSNEKLGRAKVAIDEFVSRDPLKWLENAHYETVAAAKELVSSPDKLNYYLAHYAYKDGKPTEELQMLRAIKLGELFGIEPSAEGMSTLMNRVKKSGLAMERSSGGKEPEFNEATKILFPGMTIKDIHQLAMDTPFIFGKEASATGFGASLAGADMILHPPVPHTLTQHTLAIFHPALAMGTRLVLGWTFKTAIEVLNSPQMFAMLRRGLNANTMATKEMVYDDLTRMMQAKGITSILPTVGAVGGEEIGSEVQ